jgi:hypothetical protein
MCLCLFSNYGDRCEFQRRRVTLVIQFDASDYYLEQMAVIKLVFYLMTVEGVIDHHQIITVPYQRRRSESKDQFTNRYFVPLLYPMGSERTFYEQYHEHHFIKIESYVITNSSLDLQASWYYPLVFPFLPVQRVALQVVLVRKALPIGSCGVFGRLMPYENTNEHVWCLCNQNWTGARCDKQVHSHRLCFASSVFIHPNICLCPLNRFGPTCRVVSTHICTPNTCENNGTCIVLDDGATLVIHAE